MKNRYFQTHYVIDKERPKTIAFFGIGDGVLARLVCQRALRYGNVRIIILPTRRKDFSPEIRGKLDFDDIRISSNVKNDGNFRNVIIHNLECYAGSLEIIVRQNSRHIAMIECDLAFIMHRDPERARKSYLQAKCKAFVFDYYMIESRLKKYDGSGCNNIIVGLDEYGNSNITKQYIDNDESGMFVQMKVVR